MKSQTIHCVTQTGCKLRCVSLAGSIFWTMFAAKGIPSQIHGCVAGAKTAMLSRSRSLQPQQPVMSADFTRSLQVCCFMPFLLRIAFLT